MLDIAMITDTFICLRHDPMVCEVVKSAKRECPLYSIGRIFRGCIFSYNLYNDHVHIINASRAFRNHTHATTVIVPSSRTTRNSRSNTCAVPRTLTQRRTYILDAPSTAADPEFQKEGGRPSRAAKMRKIMIFMTHLINFRSDV